MIKKKAKKPHFSIEKLEDALLDLANDFNKEYPSMKKFTNVDVDGIEDEGFFLIVLKKNVKIPSEQKAYCKLSFGRQMTLQDIMVGIDDFVENLFKVDEPIGEA